MVGCCFCLFFHFSFLVIIASPRRHRGRARARAVAIFHFSNYLLAGQTTAQIRTHTHTHVAGTWLWLLCHALLRVFARLSRVHFVHYIQLYLCACIFSVCARARRDSFCFCFAKWAFARFAYLHTLCWLFINNNFKSVNIQLCLLCHFALANMKREGEGENPSIHASIRLYGNHINSRW